MSNSNNIFGVSKFYAAPSDVSFYFSLASAVRASQVFDDTIDFPCIRVHRVGVTELVDNGIENPAYVAFLDHADIRKMAQLSDEQVADIQQKIGDGLTGEGLSHFIAGI